MVNASPAPTAPTPANAAAERLEVSAQAYRQLRVLARARLRSGGREALLDTTALVHEAYLHKLAADGRASAGRGLGSIPRFQSE